MSDYPSSLRVAPLTSWPGGFTKTRKPSPFSATLGSTLEILGRELSHLDARTPVLEVAIPPEQFRIDGRPRAQAKAEHPGVVVSLPHSNQGPKRFSADLFDSWQGNLRAIALGLEALRKVDRYGITRNGEQYAGFRALDAAPTGPATRVEALAWLTEKAQWSFSLIEDPSRAESAYRAAARRLHPDAPGGTTDAFQQLEQVMRLIRGES